MLNRPHIKSLYFLIHNAPSCIPKLFDGLFDHGVEEGWDKTGDHPMLQHGVNVSKQIGVNNAFLF